MLTQRRASFIGVAAVFCLAGLSARGSAQDRDYWLRTERNGVAFGWEHIRGTQLPGGAREYRIERHFEIDVVGHNPQEIVQEVALRVDERLRPLSFDFQQHSQVRRTRVSGQCLDGRMHLDITDGTGETRHSEVSCDAATFSETLPDLIARRSGERSFRISLLDTATGQLRPIEIEIVRADDFEIEARVGDLGTYRVDRRGEVREIERANLRMTTARAEAQEAQKIATLNTADGYTWTVTAKGPSPNLFRVQKAQIEVSWRGVPLDEFRLDDSRQKVVRTSVVEGTHRAVIEITRTAPRSLGIQAPVPAAGLAAFLADDEYIRPTHATVRRQLDELRGTEQDAFAIVQRILAWISTHISPELIAETLSAPEVLQRRSGKCSEYAILFASLARAAGIPTKIVLGEASAGPHWVGHMWNEVWIGEWLGVDASMGVFVVGPSHLKLVDAATVEGTQRLRMRLVDNLALEILGFEEEVPISAEALETGLVGDTYTNAAFRCRWSRPDASWTLADHTAGSIVSVVLQPPRPPIVKSELTLFPVPPGSSARALLDGRIKALGARVGPLEILETNEIEIAGRPAARVAFKTQNAQPGAPAALVSENCLVVEGASGYLFKVVFAEGGEVEARATFRGLLEAFERVP